MPVKDADVAVDKIRLLYVEDDPALRVLLAEQLRLHDSIESVAIAGDPQEALNLLESTTCDAAVLDVSLGAGRLNGFELGLAMRAIHGDLPIVMFSQHPPARIEDVLPAVERHNWSYTQKRGHLDIDDLVGVVRKTMRGIGRFDVTDSQHGRTGSEVLQRLTPRQREVMALASTGLDARAIAEQLHLAHVSVRREMSRAYKVLVPGAPAGTDLRTAAVLEYLRISDSVGTGAR